LNPEERNMTRYTTPILAICLSALITAGCGDASASDSVGGKCARMCERADGCQNVEADDDCVSVCEEAVAAAASLGGTCPGSLDDFIACHTQLSCGELFARALGGYYDDECVATQQALDRCTPGAPGDPDPRDQQPGTDELELACEAFCETGDECPNLVPDADCVQGCYEGFGQFLDGTSECSEALINAVNCQAALSCGELGARVNGSNGFDSCRDSDRLAESLCLY
jgi:hypothetical protein